MAGVIELQPWTTMSGSGNVDVSQPQAGWVDVSDYADGLFWVNVKDITGSVQLHLQSAPDDDDSYFYSVVQSITTTGTALRINRFADATTPMMRYLRWSLRSGTDWSITFRISSVLQTQ